MSRSSKRNPKNLNLAIGISVAILVIAVAAFILSPEACHATGTTSDQTCAAKTTKESCGGDCKWERKLFSALTSSGGGKKQDPNLNKPTPPLPQPKPTPPSSGSQCLCGAGKNDYSGKECGKSRGAAGGDNFCMDDYETGGICGNTGGKTGCDGKNSRCTGFTTQSACTNPNLGCTWGTKSDNVQDGCVMTTRTPHTERGGYDISDCKMNSVIERIHSGCMQGDKDPSSLCSDNNIQNCCDVARRACTDESAVTKGPCGTGGGPFVCFDGGECEQRSTAQGCQSQCYFPANNEAAIQKCNDDNGVEGFCRRRRRWRR